MNPVEDLNSCIFDGSARLEQIRHIARHKRVGPTGLLIATLAVLSCHLSPNTRVDVGKGPGSLNLFVAIVGEPGSEKSRTMRAALDVLNVENPAVDFEVRTPGSGEGINSAYAEKTHYDEAEKRRITEPGLESVLWQESEVTALDALMGRKGSTLQAQLTKMFTAEFLNFSNKDGGPVIEDGSYRASFLLGVQPGRAEALLADADQGFPQRFVWVDTLDRSRMRLTDYPEKPPVSVRIPKYPNGIIEGCESARNQVISASDDGLIDGKHNGLNSHATFTRSKVAALLAVLREHDRMTEDDWQRAGYIMESSEQARHLCVQHREKKLEAVQELKGKRQDREEEKLVQKTKARILAFLAKEERRDRWVAKSPIQQSFPSGRWRGENLEIALGRLVESGQLQRVENPRSPGNWLYALPHVPRP